MRDATLTVQQVELLERPQNWKLIGSGFRPDVEEHEQPMHRAWMEQHTHAHAHVEILIVLDGVGSHGLGGSIYPMSPGTIFLFNAFEEHDILAPSWGPAATHLWVMIVQDAYIARCFSINNPHTAALWTLYLTPAEIGFPVEKLLDGTVARPDSPNAPTRLRLLSAASALAAAIIQHGDGEPRRCEHDSFQRQIVDTVCRHIRRTAGRGASLDSLARIAGYSKYHFLRIFKEHTGVTVHRYTEECRLRRVREMKLDGLTKTEMAASLGFSGLAAFSRWHRNHT